MSAHTIKIGDLALNERGAFKIGPFGSSLKKSELVGTGIPVVGIENILPNQFEKGFRRFVSPAKFQELSDYEIGPDDVLVTTMGTIGRAAVVPHNLGKAIFDSHLFRMRIDTDRVFPGYLCYAINSSVVDLQLQRMARGAIMQGLNTTILRECDIPLPDLHEQKRIAGQLEQADRLRRTRRYVLELGDNMLPAAFLEIFGDPMENPRGWKRAKVRELGKVQTGNTPPRDEVANYGRAVEWIKSDNISLDKLYPTRAKEMLSDQGMDLGTVVPPGSILVTCIAGSATSIGNVCITDRSVAFNQQINAVTPHMGVLPFFLYGLFLAAKPFVQRNTTTAMKRMITKSKLEELLFVWPPETAQRQFSQVVSTHERLRAGQREALRQADHFFRSLLHQAFDLNG